MLQTPRKAKQENLTSTHAPMIHAYSPHTMMQHITHVSISPGVRYIVPHSITPCPTLQKHVCAFGDSLACSRACHQAGACRSACECLMPARFHHQGCDPQEPVQGNFYSLEQSVPHWGLKPCAPHTWFPKR